MAVNWRSDVDRARAEAAARGLPLLLDFFNPECPGCKKMDAGTYGDESLAAFLEAAFVPLRVPHDDPALARTYGVRSTPTLVLTDAAGVEFHRVQGVLPPYGLRDALSLGLAKAGILRGELGPACARLEDLAARAGGETQAEAIYQLGQCRFRQGGDRAELKRSFERLAASHPGSPWTAQAEPYRLI